MPLNAADVLRELKSKPQYNPIYFLHGEEPYYIDKIAAFIEENAIPPHEKGFNQTIVYGKDVSMNVILGSAKRFPMMAQRQLVMVKEAQDISDFGQDKAKEMLQAYLEKPLPSTILVFAYKNKKLNGNTKLYKDLDKKQLLIESKPLYDNQLPKWITDVVKEKGHGIGEKASVLLAEYIGNDLNRINNELDKMLINFTTKTEITEEHIAKYVGVSKEYNTFELQKALGLKDILKSNKIVNYFEANPKNNPLIPIIALLFGYFSKLLLVHQATDKSKGNLASVLKVNPFFVDDYLVATRNYPLVKVIQIIGFLREADLRSKGVDSNAEDGQILRELVFKILHI